MNNTLLDLSGLADIAIHVVVVVVLGLLARYLPRVIDAVDRFLDLKQTDQQKEHVKDEITAAIGTIETKLDQRAMQVAHVNISNPYIMAAAHGVIANLPIEAANLGITADTIANRIVGGVDTLSRSAPVAAPQTIVVQPSAVSLAG